MTSNQTPQSNGCLIGCGATILLIAVLGLIGSISSMMETPEQKAAKEAQVLNEWFEGGSEYSCENQLKEQLRDPNSYERDGEFTTLTNDGIKRTITWKFRSKNGFGGYAPAIGMCLITKDNKGTVKATVLGE